MTDSSDSIPEATYLHTTPLGWRKDAPVESTDSLSVVFESMGCNVNSCVCVCVCSLLQSYNPFSNLDYTETDWPG